MDRTLEVAEDLVKDGLVTVDEARQFTKLGRTRLYELMSSGELPFVKIGVSRRIPRRALVALAVTHLVLSRDGKAV